MTTHPTASIGLVGCVCALALGLVPACGGDSEPEKAATYGTCDRSETEFTCIEATGNAFVIAGQKQGCAEVEGTWMAEACPTTNAIGCCTYHFDGDGTSFRECFYHGTQATDPEDICLNVYDNGEWEPAH